MTDSLITVHAHTDEWLLTDDGQVDALVAGRTGAEVDPAPVEGLVGRWHGVQPQGWRVMAGHKLRPAAPEQVPLHRALREGELAAGVKTAGKGGGGFDSTAGSWYGGVQWRGRAGVWEGDVVIGSLERYVA